MNFLPNIIFFLEIVYLLVPAAVANMMPVFVRKINFLNYPIDFSFKLYGKKLFGDNKTFRGFFFGIVFSIILVGIQKLVYSYNIFKEISLVNYSEINLFTFGFLIGFGVMIGDLVGSFIKRRLNFKPGESLYILDQINGGIGFAVLVVPFYFRSWSLALWIIIIWLFGHLILKYSGYLLGIYKEKI